MRNTLQSPQASMKPQSRNCDIRDGNDRDSPSEVAAKCRENALKMLRVYIGGISNSTEELLDHFQSLLKSSNIN